MRVRAIPRPAVEALLVLVGGLSLYGAASGLEIALGTGPVGGALLEETGKALVILVAGWLGGRKAVSERHPRRQIRATNLGIARGLSLGLSAVAMFVLAENMAYFSVFPEAGILKRLLWSMPGHLVAALLEALGSLWLLRRCDWRGALLAGMSLVLAVLWHVAMNLLATGPLTALVFTTGALLAPSLFLILLLLYLDRAYLGGFLHGAD
jgi:hypothetical protein